ncbi:hypothetical protein D3C79_1098300 [compost metagenome]
MLLELTNQTSYLTDLTGDFQLLEVIDDDLAVVEITPVGGDPIVDPATVVHPRRRRLVSRHRPKTPSGDGFQRP